MNGLFQAGVEIQDYFRARGWPFCFIGGLAVLRWGEIRMTQDLDVCLLCGFGNEGKFVTQLLNSFKARIGDAEKFALSNRILLLETDSGAFFDVTLSGLPFEEEMIRRATPFTFAPGCHLLTCSAEDLVVMKAFAGRDKDWADVEGIVDRQGDTLDRESIINALEPLCDIKNAPDIITKLQNYFRS